MERVRVRSRRRIANSGEHRKHDGESEVTANHGGIKTKSSEPDARAVKGAKALIFRIFTPVPGQPDKGMAPIKLKNPHALTTKCQKKRMPFGTR
jgi:hypothetical protein